MNGSKYLEEELLTVSDVNKILVNKLNYKDFNILNYTLKLISEKIGLLGEHARLIVLILDLNGMEKELHFFVKFFPFLDMSAVFARETGAFAKEVFINAVLFNKMKKSGIEIIQECVADCYFTEPERLLVFDDLSKHGFEILNKRKDFNFDMISIVLQSLAKLHATSIIYEEKKSKESKRKYRLIEDYENEFEESFFNDKVDFINLKGIDASIKAILTEIDLFNYPSTLASGKDFKAVAKKCCYKVYELVKPSNMYRNVVSHGDLWSSNLLMKFNQHGKPTECKFVDFQLSRYAPPAQDVLAVLHLTTSLEFRKHHMHELLRVYYSSLENYVKLAGYSLEGSIPFGDFLHSCEEHKPFALVQTATYFQLILVEGDFLNEIYADPTLSHRTFYENRSPLVVGYANKDEYYKKKLHESIQDLKDYCECL